MTSLASFRPIALPLIVVACGVALACGSSSSDSSSGGAGPGGDDGGTSGDAGGNVDGGSSGTTCTAPVTISGIITAPSGNYPIPGVHVFPQSGTPAPIAHGPGSCPTVPAGAFTTGADGHYSLSVSGAASVNVTAQIGKWRKTVPVDVSSCAPQVVNIPFAGSPAGGDGPAIAISTGGGDMLECVLNRMGIYGFATIFHGTNGANASAPTSSSDLWGGGNLSKYDMVILSCEAAETANVDPTALSTYLDAGGFVYAEHFGYNWFNGTPGIATWITGSQPQTGTTNGVLGASPEALQMQSYLAKSALNGGKLPMLNAYDNVTVAGGDAAISLIDTDAVATVPNVPALVTWTTPVGSASPLGRVVYSDFHMGSSAGDYGTAPGTFIVPPGSTSPGGCADKVLAPDELAFLYSVYDSLSCSP